MDFQYKKDNLSIEKTLTLEWLETNGLGGYASSSILNCHTRKYHGLLVPSLNKPFGKFVLLSKLEDVFFHNETEHFLTAHNYTGAFLDGSFDFFKEFILTTHPHFIYKFGDAILTKEILMPREENTVLIKYKLHNTAKNHPGKIRIRPLIAYRNFHDLTHENNYLKTEIENLKDGIKFTPYCEMPDLFLQTNNIFTFDAEPLWYKNFDYKKEQERGFEHEEDLFSPGKFVLEFDKKNEIIISASLNEEIFILNKKWSNEIKRRTQLEIKLSKTPFEKQLQKTVLSFLKKDPDGEQLSVTAGYHWFCEWGRDSLIFLSGLLLCPKQEKQCLNILKYFSANEKDGLIPNVIGEDLTKNIYNTVDASLWFAYAIQQYYLATNDLKSINKYFWKTLKNIFTFYQIGTHYNIKMDANGLISAGDNENKFNITWMDAIVNGTSAVKRNGYQVEVNALWYNMLCFMVELGQVLKDPIVNDIEPLLNKFKPAFLNTFWDEKIGYLRDFVDLNFPDNPKSLAIRPNQIFAVSLPYSPLPHKIMIDIIETVKKHLLTPFGLRTLAKDDPDYIGTYAGSPASRDAAYHNGTVWPWLLGHFARAFSKTHDRKTLLETLKPCISALEKHLHETGIGTISEIFSGDEPHQADGCISQAWSGAEMLCMLEICK